MIQKFNCCSALGLCSGSRMNRERRRTALKLKDNFEKSSFSVAGLESAMVPVVPVPGL